MRIGRTILIRAAVTLSVAGAVLAGVAISGSTAPHANSIQSHVIASDTAPPVFYHN